MAFVVSPLVNAITLLGPVPLLVATREMVATSVFLCCVPEPPVPIVMFMALT